MDKFMCIKEANSFKKSITVAKQGDSFEFCNEPKV